MHLLGPASPGGGHGRTTKILCTSNSGRMTMSARIGVIALTVILSFLNVSRLASHPAEASAVLRIKRLDVFYRLNPSDPWRTPEESGGLRFNNDDTLRVLTEVSASFARVRITQTVFIEQRGHRLQLREKAPLEVVSLPEQNMRITAHYEMPGLVLARPKWLTEDRPLMLRVIISNGGKRVEKLLEYPFNFEE